MFSGNPAGYPWSWISGRPGVLRAASWDRCWRNWLTSLRDVSFWSKQTPNAAAEIYGKILQESPQQARATIGLARSLVRMERFDEASELIAGLEKRGFLEPEAEQLKAAVELHASGATDLDTCRRAAQANPTSSACCRGNRNWSSSTGASWRCCCFDLRIWAGFPPATIFFPEPLVLAGEFA
jgi:hypothetical protein